MRKIDPAALAALSPPEQEEARNLLADLERQYKENPLLRYEPHPKQHEFHGSRASLKAFLGGNRSGKTTAGVLDDIIQAVDESALPDSLKPYKKYEPPFYCRIICPDFTSTLEGVILQKLREWIPADQLVGGKFDKAYDKAKRKLNFKNGSWFDFLTFEQDLDKFGGAALHRVHYDEEPPRDIRRESMMRLIDYGGDELFTMTPLEGMNWMFDEVWEAWQKHLLKDAIVIVVDMDDNPYLNQETKERALAGLSSEEREARKSGRFVSFAGMIYNDFSRHDHIIPEIELPETRKIYTGIDPGIRHMAAVLWVCHTTDDRLIVFDELALQGATVEQVATAIKLTNFKWGTKGAGNSPIIPYGNFIDPAARNRSNQTGRSDQHNFVEHGIVTILAQNDVGPGINKVKERLQTKRLFVCANCTTLIDEFRKYRWTAAGRSHNEPKEEPVKADDHLLDALRYVVMSMPQAPTAVHNTRPMTPVEKYLQEDMEGRNFRRAKPINTPMGAIFQ
jgi:phage terminase large subunit-like protein